MFSRRRRYRRSHAEGNTFVEAASQETASRDKENPNKFSLPLSRSPSPILNVARIAQATPESIASQEEADFGQERETSIQEEEDIQEGPGDQEYSFKQEYLDDQGEPDDRDKTRRSGAAPAENELAGVLDPFTEGRKKLSEFWPIYLKEADNFDRELSEGWNNMLEVILIFAALFSAISTAFVLESSKGLKPDPADSAAATLLLISQTLLVMSNQSMLAPAMLVSEPAPFVPSGSAVVVNVLWFTSLILSVSVTLVAMLAKEWTHLFMVGRTGLPMEQARKRRKRFDGVKTWKMEGVITALPTLMHIALFLFAGGLCVYLWNIHIGVAVPVVVLTLLTALIYVVALALPLVHDYCPYATALSKLIKSYHGTWSRKQERQPELDVSSDNVPMDVTTSRTLAWMISNSDVPSSVDLALQAIAGTSFEIPAEALWECDVSGAIYSRLKKCLEAPDLVTVEQLKRIEAYDSPTFSSILAYAHALTQMVVGRREHIFSPPSTGDSPEKETDVLFKCEGLYVSLCNLASPNIKAVGYAARAAWKQGQHGKRWGEPPHLLDASELVIILLNQPQSPSWHPSISSLFIALCSETIRWASASWDTDNRLQILKTTLEIGHLANKNGLPSNEYARAVSMIGLSMNMYDQPPFGDVVRHIFRSDAPEATLQENTELCLMLGLFGLLRALESEHPLESDSHPIFGLLWDRPFEEETRPELPSVNLGNIDLTRHVVETAFDCHQCLAKRNIENWHLDMAIADMLKRVRKPWATPIATALLECPASDILRNGCVYYIAQNEPRVTGAGAALLSNAIYEATRLQPRYHRLDEDDLLRLTLHFESVSAHGEGDVHAVVHALLRRLLHEDMFGDLVILIARARSTGVLRQWRGIKAGYVVQFWGEHVIQLGRSMHQESESNPVAEKLQGLFASGEEPTDWVGTVLEGTMELSNMLWREIKKPEDSSVTPENRVFRWTRLIWRSQRAESHPGESV